MPNDTISITTTCALLPEIQETEPVRHLHSVSCPTIPLASRWGNAKIKGLGRMYGFASGSGTMTF